MGQSSILMVITLGIVFSIVSINTNKRIDDVSKKAESYYADNVSQNICNSATEMLLSKIADDNNFRVNNLTSRHMLNGYVKYTIDDTVINSEDKIKIEVQARYGGEEAENILIASLPDNGFVPGAVKAAVSTNNDIKTLGNLVIDGRDHDENGNLIPGQGTLGIWTTGSMNQSGNSHIGGHDGTDYAPSKPGNSNIIKTN